jgi:hypothetical protein
MRRRCGTRTIIFACLLLAGCRTRIAAPTPAQVAMQNVLAIDDKLGSARNHASETSSLEDAVREYVTALDAVDFTGCPPDFVEAFSAHRDAWEEALPFLEQFPEMRGEMHSLFEKLKADPMTNPEIETLDKRIWDTWADVEAAAR